VRLQKGSAASRPGKGRGGAGAAHLERPLADALGQVRLAAGRAVAIGVPRVPLLAVLVPGRAARRKVVEEEVGAADAVDGLLTADLGALLGMRGSTRRASDRRDTGLAKGAGAGRARAARGESVRARAHRGFLPSEVRHDLDAAPEAGQKLQYRAGARLNIWQGLGLCGAAAATGCKNPKHGGREHLRAATAAVRVEVEERTRRIGAVKERTALQATREGGAREHHAVQRTLSSEVGNDLSRARSAGKFAQHGAGSAAQRGPAHSAFRQLPTKRLSS
jgi:hypothetical protein